MSFKNPDAEIRLIGWPAVIVIIILVVDAAEAIIRTIELIARHI